MLNPARKYYTVAITSYVIFLRENEVLLMRRAKTGYHDGDYGLPSGHVEEGEYSLAAAIREAKEEVGVCVEQNNLMLVHVMHRHCGDHECIEMFFMAKKWDGELINAEPNKCDEIRWVKVDDLPKNTIPYIRMAIEKISQNILYSEFLETE